MIKKLYNMVLGQELDLREKIFRIILLLGSLAAVVGNVESIIIKASYKMNFSLVIFFFVMLIALVATFKYRKMNFAAIILGSFGIVVVFPSLFFWSGGIEGGSTLWLALVLLYVFLMFEGKRLIFFVALAVIVDAGVYWIGYTHPEYIKTLPSQAAVCMDSLFSVLAVGLLGGLIVKIQLRTFNIERGISKRQKKELEDVSNSKNAFFTNMSHEIRTPINSIIGWNEMILRQNPTGDIQEYAENVQSASEMLLTLVNDILDLSQMENKKMEIVSMRYEVRDILKDLIHMIQVRIQEKSLQFQIDIDENIPSVLLGDEKRIKQIVLNLLTNAVKYTDKGYVRLSVSAKEREEGYAQLKISVADSGIGIRKEDLDSLYNVFQRVDTKKNREVEGSGLGLSIVKQLLDLMGGKISVDSIYTKGSVFTVILNQKIIDSKPIGPVNLLELGDQKKKGSYYQQSFEAPEARVLVVDDNIMNSWIITKLLSSTKVQVDSASSGMECLEKTKQKYYHVILMDHLMPEMDGVETLKQIRIQENGLCRESAVVLVTASSIGEGRKVYQENHFDGFIEKPVKGDKLEEEILKFLPEDIIEYRSTMNYYSEDDALQKISKKKRKHIYITTDCICDLPERLIEKYDIRVVYLYIKTGLGRFADTREIDSDNLRQYLSDDTNNAQTDGISVEEYEDFFANALTEADEIIHISASKEFSRSFSVAQKAARGFDHVHIVDSEQISGGQGLLVLCAAELIMKGYDTAGILEKMEQMKKYIEYYMVLPSTKYFYQSGFMYRVGSIASDLFHIHPVLKMSRGHMKIVTAYVGDNSKARRHFLRRQLHNRRKINQDVVMFTHIGCSAKQLSAMRTELTRYIPFENVIMQKGSFSLGCNCGVGAIGVAYLRKTKDDSKEESYWN